MATEYSVFRGENGNWIPAGKVETHSPETAAKLVDQERGLAYLVVPTTNCHFVNTGTEHVTRVVAKKYDGPDFPLVGQQEIDPEPTPEPEPVTA